MKRRYLLLFFIILLLNCPRHPSPGARKKIEVYYLASILADLARPEPIITGLFTRDGLKIGRLENHNAGYSLFLSRLGLYDLLDSLPLDFVIADVPVPDRRFLTISRNLGYRIKNYDGIRFGAVCADAETLSIQDQITLSVIKERTDILLVMEPRFLRQPPVRIDFLVRRRELQDTSLSRIKTRPDPTWNARAAAFIKRLNDTLNTKFSMTAPSFSEFILDRLARSAGVNTILYPGRMFLADTAPADFNLRDLLLAVDATVRLKKGVFPRDSLLKWQAANQYLMRGQPDKNTPALVPDPEGVYVLDLLLR